VSIEIRTAASIAQQAGRQAVLDAMHLRGRPSPWEVSEAWLKIGVMTSFHNAIREKRIPACRLYDEMKLGEIVNIPGIDGLSKGHPVDLTVMYPLVTDRNCNPWDDTNRCAAGLIEIKKEFGLVGGDADFLRAISASNTVEPRLAWVLLVVFINGRTLEQVQENEGIVSRRVTGLDRLTACEPQEAQSTANYGVKDRWFDVVCYGKAVQSDTTEQVLGTRT
jgi:hypothetical protein